MTAIQSLDAYVPIVGNLATRQTSRKTRASVLTRYVDDDECIDGFSDEIQSGIDGGEGGDHPEPEREDRAEILNILQESRRHQAGKASVRSAAFQTHKKAIYAAARRNGKEISKSGIGYIEDARAKIRAFKDQETSYEKYFKDFEESSVIQERSFDLLSLMYRTLLEDLSPRRSEEINAASEMLKSNPLRRQIALKKFSRSARLRVEEARENEKLATDASALIKHYKNLLHS